MSLDLVKSNTSNIRRSLIVVPDIVTGLYVAIELAKITLNAVSQPV